MTGARGEAIIERGDIEYRILFTNRALAEAESATGKSILVIARGFVNGATGIGDVAQLLSIGLEAARRDSKSGGPQGRAYTLADAYRIMDEVGFTAVARAVMESIAVVIRYDGDDDTARDVERESPNA